MKGSSFGRRLELAVAVAERLSSDAAFDAVYDEEVRSHSEQHWTPVAVAARAANLLTRSGATRIVDVGSGAGKFCIVGALTTGAEFVGVERREKLVRVAREASASLGATRTTFVHSNVDSFSFEGFDGVYLYNPFYEQISKHTVLIDHYIERSGAAHRYFVRAVEERLRAHLSPLTVVTFNGFGGLIPRDYRFMGDEPAGNDRLELWTKLGPQCR